MFISTAICIKTFIGTVKVGIKYECNLLVVPAIVQIQKDRQLPDAFTDLLIRQGECVPLLAPKKWKVWWLTLLGLFFTQLWTIDVMPY
jgi:hypothetical protein